MGEPAGEAQSGMPPAVMQVAAPPATGVRRPPVTGEPGVDEALSRLVELRDLPVAEHADVFSYVHERLAEALSDLGTQEDQAIPDDYDQVDGPAPELAGDEPTLHEGYGHDSYGAPAEPGY